MIERKGRGGVATREAQRNRDCDAGYIARVARRWRNSAAASAFNQQRI
jgi:hypothetical protein